jgi:hypothetical protein
MFIGLSEFSGAFGNSQHYRTRCSLELVQKFAPFPGKAVTNLNSDDDKLEGKLEGYSVCVKLFVN